MTTRVRLVFACLLVAAIGGLIVYSLRLSMAPPLQVAPPTPTIRNTDVEDDSGTNHPDIRIDVATFIDPDHSSRTRVTDDVAQRIFTVENDQEMLAVQSTARNREEKQTIRNEAFNLLQRSDDPHLCELLLNVLADTDEAERMRAFAIQHLGVLLHIKPHLVHATTQSTLQQHLSSPLPALRREALFALVAINNPLALETLENAPTDPLWSQDLDIIVHLFHQRELKAHIATIRQLAYHTDDSVKLAALFVLGDWADRESHAIFEEHAHSKVPVIRQAGIHGLAQLKAATTP